MITEYGMSEELGPLTFGTKKWRSIFRSWYITTPYYSDAIAYAIDKEASTYMETAIKRQKIFLMRIWKLHFIAARLMEVETMEADEFKKIMQGEAVVEKEEQA